MAKITSKRARARQHEDHIAKLFNGKVSPTSGGADNDGGDVRLKDENTLFECKMKGAPGESILKRRPVMTQQMQKIAYEAYEEGREPALALRFFDPECPLANNDGYVDLVARLATDDAARSERLTNGV